MLKSRILKVSLLVAVLGGFRVQASQVLSEETNQKICEQMLGLTLKSVEPMEFDATKGLGMRGFLGAYPQPTGENAVTLANQGLMYWGHSFSVKKTIEEAQAHDAQWNGLGKIAYLISDVDVSDLTEDTDMAVVHARFEKIFATSPLIYWDDSEQIIKKDSTIEPKMVVVDKAIAGQLIVKESVDYFTSDGRGPRFTQSGWVFPKVRGELIAANLFGSGSGTIKNILRNARKLIAQGYSVKFNHNFQESLDAARDQWRSEKNEQGELVMVQNSRYRHADVYNKALDAFKSGHAFSVEVRNPEGKLMAGTLGERHGNLIALETVFYPHRDSGNGNIDMAKVAVVGAFQRMNEKGILIADAGMVTDFTANLKGVYVSADQFAADVKALRDLGPIDLEFERDWTPPAAQANP